jgi:hypothetical protein
MILAMAVGLTVLITCVTIVHVLARGWIEILAAGLAAHTVLHVCAAKNTILGEALVAPEDGNLTKVKRCEKFALAVGKLIDMFRECDCAAHDWRAAGGRAECAVSTAGNIERLSPGSGAIDRVPAGAVVRGDTPKDVR